MQEKLAKRILGTELPTQTNSRTTQLRRDACTRKGQGAKLPLGHQRYDFNTGPRHDFQSGGAKVLKWVSMSNITPILLSFGSNQKSNVREMFCGRTRFL